MHVLKACLDDGQSRSHLPKSGLENLMMIFFRYRLIDICMWRLQPLVFMCPSNSQITPVPANFVSKVPLLRTPSDDVVTTAH